MCIGVLDPDTDKLSGESVFFALVLQLLIAVVGILTLVAQAEREAVSTRSCVGYHPARSQNSTVLGLAGVEREEVSERVGGRVPGKGVDFVETLGGHFLLPGAAYRNITVQVLL